MRVVKYKTHWTYRGRGTKRQEPLAEFVLDIPYLIEDNGVIPPLHVLNEVLQTGGNNGGMSPGTSWRGFRITEAEYAELVEALLKLNINEARQKHPYLRFQKIIIDESLHHAPTYTDWKAAVARKYSKT